MNPSDLHRLLEAVAAGEITPRQAQERLAELPYADLGFAKLDLHRELRVGVPEAVFAEGKNADDLRLIVERMLAAHGKVLVTRLTPAAAAKLIAAVAALGGGSAGEVGGGGDRKIGDGPEMAGEANGGTTRGDGGGVGPGDGDGVSGDRGEGRREAGGWGASDGGAGVSGAEYHPRARVLTYGAGSTAGGLPIAVVAAGTSDLPVAEEAAVCAEWFGHPVRRVYDVGIAGLHRLLDRLPEIRRCGVVIAVAGMDGALPTVLAGLVRTPIVAVPTSVGYGASFGGLAPLLTMLTGCAPGVGVVNIDNGYGAAVLASRIARPASGAADAVAGAADIADPDAAGPDAVAGAADVAGPDVAGPDAAGPDAAGPDAAGPDAAGPDAAGPDAAGLDAAGLDVVAGDAAAGADSAGAGHGAPFTGAAHASGAPASNAADVANAVSVPSIGATAATGAATGSDAVVARGAAHAACATAMQGIAASEVAGVGDSISVLHHASGADDGKEDR